MGQVLDNIQSSPTRERGTEVEVWLLQAGPQLLQSLTCLGGSVPPAQTRCGLWSSSWGRACRVYALLTEETVTATELWEAFQRKVLAGIIQDRQDHWKGFQKTSSGDSIRIKIKSRKGDDAKRAQWEALKTETRGR